MLTHAILDDRAREALRACLPDALRDATFTALLKVGLSS